MKNLKKFLAVVVSVAIMATSMATAFAADTSTDPLAAYPEAALMRDLGVLQGSNGGVTEAYLKQTPVRIQAAVLTLRLTGNEANARAYTGLAHFQDTVADTYWAKNIMGYLKANAIFGWSGDATGKFNPEAKIQKAEFAKVLLKAMGYDQGTHYEWGNNGDGVLAAYKAAGLTSLLDADNNITMNDIAVAINEALTKPVRGSSTVTLAQAVAKVNPDFKAAALAKGLVKPVTISAVAAPNLGSAVEGAIVAPPAQVVATMTDGSTKNVDVKWSAEKFDTSAVGDATLTGTIDGFAAGVTATLKVVAAAITNVEDVAFEDVYVGDEVTLPATVDATFSNGKVDAVPVTWAPADVDTSAAADLTFKGTVAGYDKEVTATMTVVENVIESVAAVDDVNINEGDSLVLPETVEATYTNGDVAEVPVVWDTTAVDVNAPAKYAVKGTVEGFEAGAAVNVNVAAVALDFTLSANNYSEVTVTFNKAVAADKLVAANFTVNGAAPVNAAVLDSKSVRLTAAAKIAAQGKYDVTAKTAVGMAADTPKTLSSVIDATVPEVVGVDAVGNTSFKVTLSEPVDAATLVLSNFKLDNAYFSAGVPARDVTGRVVTVTPTNRLTAGVHKVSISNLKDLAGYVIAPVVDKEFVVATDTTAPSFSSVESATQTKVVVVMSEDLANAGSVTSVPAAAGFAVSGNKITLTYGVGAASVPVNGLTVTLKSITDVYGNVAGDISVSIPAPTLDMTKPAFVSVAAEGGNSPATIVVAFSKDVQISGTITVKDSDGNTALSGASAVYKDSDGNTVASKLSISGNLVPGAYKVSVTGVKDTTGLENVMVPVVDQPVTVADKTSPKVTFAVDAAAKKIYAIFDEAVTKATAENKANYSYVDAASAVHSLNADTTVKLLADGQTVEIAFVAADWAAIKFLQIAGIADASGNAVAVTSQDVSKIAALTALTATASVTGSNTIVVTFSRSLVASTVSLNDFAVTAGGTAIRVYNAVPSGSKVTLSTVDTMTADAKFGGKAVAVAMGSTVTAADAYGLQVAANTALTTSDGIVPVASGVTKASVVGGNTVIRVALSEDLKAMVGDVNNGQFYVVIDGVVRTATVNVQDKATVVAASNGDTAQLVVTVAAALSGKSYAVTFTPASPATLVDASLAANALKAFTFSGTVE